MNEVNEKRKIVSHASSAISLSLEDLALLQEYDRTLMTKIAGRAPALAESTETEAES
jgi:hypothetical protein